VEKNEPSAMMSRAKMCLSNGNRFYHRKSIGSFAVKTRILISQITELIIHAALTQPEHHLILVFEIVLESSTSHSKLFFGETSAPEVKKF